jgi:hypothetical protein
MQYVCLAAILPRAADERGASQTKTKQKMSQG